LAKAQEESWEALFDPAPLQQNDSDLNDKRSMIREPNGLCIVTKRADTESTGPLLNHPRSASLSKIGPFCFAAQFAQYCSAPSTMCQS
jgi:hypothetical protein